MREIFAFSLEADLETDNLETDSHPLLRGAKSTVKKITPEDSRGEPYFEIQGFGTPERVGRIVSELPGVSSFTKSSLREYRIDPSRISSDTRNPLSTMKTQEHTITPAFWGKPKS